MGLYDSMTASVSGMTVSGNYLTNIAQNMSNVGTVGYKNVNTRFESMINQPNWTQAMSGDNIVGSVVGAGPLGAGGATMSSVIRSTQQGSLQTTTSSTDLAVSGKGFFVVSDSTGKCFLTRSGSFVPDANGNLVNAAGFFLMGAGSSGVSASNASTLTGLQVVNIGAASPQSSVTIGPNGALSYQNASGATVTPFQIPIASVPSPDNLATQSGNVFSLTELSGEAQINVAGAAGFGTIRSGNLEASTVDVATELSNMIVAQRGYQANSQAMKASADMMDTLVKLNIA
jgi:flagellar hook protein FlgE